MAQLSIPDEAHRALKKHCKKNKLGMGETAALFIKEGILRGSLDKCENANQGKSKPKLEGG